MQGSVDRRATHVRTVRYSRTLAPRAAGVSRYMELAVNIARPPLSTTARLGGALLAAATLALGACGGAAPPTASPGARDALVQPDQPWSISFPEDACTLTGQGERATSGSCGRLGQAALGAERSAQLGSRVAALRLLNGNPEAGTQYAKLSTARAEYSLEPSQWGELLAALRAELVTARTQEREAAFAAAPRCEAGKALLRYKACPSTEGVSDVCGPPVVVCGPPLAAGAACEHHGACASNACDWETGACK